MCQIETWRESLSWRSLSRKRVDEEDGSDQQLARVMGLFDLTALGVGSTLGLGVYVLAGSVAKVQAGPAVCISFLIAAIASAFAGLCYAEFAARVPKAGSAYVYSYVTVGECIAFIIGWNLILEYVIGTASVARGLSGYVDSLANNTMGNTLREYFPIDVDFLSSYPDFLAFGMVLLLTALLTIGVKESSILNNIFVVINLVTIAVIVIAGSIKADPHNWQITVEEIPKNVTSSAGEGGFLPFGMSGVLSGAATCFYGFVGFDAVATTGEEAKNPQRNIPLAIIFSLIITFFAYFSISTVLTMMWPYYAQDTDAPFPYVFGQLGWHTIKIIVLTGAIFALCTSLLGAMFPLPRILFAMGRDGVIFKSFANVCDRTKTPLFGTVVSGLFTGLMTLLFNLKQLIDMMSIGTLLAYTIVAVSVLLLRYEAANYEANLPHYINNNGGIWCFITRLFNLHNIKEPNSFSSKTGKYGTLVFSIGSFVIGLLIKQVSVQSNTLRTLVFTGLSISSIITIFTLIIMARQPRTVPSLPFKVPLVPLIPCLSIFINLYLMLQLDTFTWIRFLVWMIIGFCIYFTYGIVNSAQKERDSMKKIQAAAKLETIF